MRNWIFRPLLFLLIIIITFYVSLFVGSRYALILMIGIFLGLSFEGFGFGFSGAWRSMIKERNPNGIFSHLLSIGIASLFIIPLLHFNDQSLRGGVAPIGFSMIFGSFIFGVGMQIVKGCGSGILVNAGSGNIYALAALPFFSIGSFLGAYHISWWNNFNFSNPLLLDGWLGLATTLVLLLLTYFLIRYFSSPKYFKFPKKYIFFSIILAMLATFHIVVSGQPLGIVYGLGLWISKLAVGSGIDLSNSVFFKNEINAIRIKESIFTDITSLTSIGIIIGSISVGLWRKNTLNEVVSSSWMSILVIVISAFLMGYSARLAFGCNIGAFFSGISSGSIHGWLWFVSAFFGSYLGIKFRPYCGFK